MKVDAAKLRETAERAEHREWYADRRHITLCADKRAMGASLPTNHIAVFADADDAAHAAAANPQTVLALLDEIDRYRRAGIEVFQRLLASDDADQWEMSSILNINNDYPLRKP